MRTNLRTIVYAGLIFSISPAFAYDLDAIHIRTLAASCAACHGTNGNSHSTTPVLAGLDATYFSSQMLAFKNGSHSSTVMHHHAKGLTTDEIYQLANYFAEQKRLSTPELSPQTLKAKDDE